MNCYNNEKDNVLVELTLLGNEAAFEELVIRHENAVKGTALKVTRNEFSAQDAAQDAFVSAWIKLDALKDKDKFGAWVCAIAKNCAKNLVIHYNNAAADISLNLIENTEVLSNGESGILNNMSLVNLAELERDERLREAVEELSEKIRQAIKMHYFEGLTVTEISEKLSIPVGTVKWRLCEGRKLLRKEYGIMENTYVENESLVARVMRQVEQLKLWRLKVDKTGFEADYRRVLKAVEDLDDSNEKHHALADVLMHGYWWIPGEQNDKTLAKIKESAEKSHNEDVMQDVMANEFGKLRVKERIEYIKNTQIPYLTENGFVKALAYAWFWLGVGYCYENQPEEALESFKKVLEILKPRDVYYANALSAIELVEREKTTDTNYSMHASSEVYKFIGNKLYLWQQPGFTRSIGNKVDGVFDSLFFNGSLVDSLILDLNMNVGQSVTSSDGKSTLTYKESRKTVKTPAGEFENCSVYVLEDNCNGLEYCETAFCPNIGIVYQKVKRHRGTNEWYLSSYNLNGGEGLLPLFTGNSWHYRLIPDEAVIYEVESEFEITDFSNNTATVKHFCMTEAKGYNLDNWEGNILAARREYVDFEDDGKTQYLSDVKEYLEGAKRLAKTKRQKVHTEIAVDVMERIFATDPDTNPDYTQKGHWNFFGIEPVNIVGKEINISGNTFKYTFEWKDMNKHDDEGYKLLYNFIYDILDDAVGCVWSDDWKPGYHTEKDKFNYDNTVLHTTFDCLEDETVETKVGVFENCRHIMFDLKGLKGGAAYRGGKKEYWFAQGVGIVKIRAFYKNDTLSTVWDLTEYRGTGKGYFPVVDGLFRRYEPIDLKGGWHASTEYTFDTDENGTLIFRNALGTQDREAYEKMNN